ncbi:MAG: Holliday junction branch migration protein RuvA [Anaerolineae bacterium CG_4_9_14_3_um_filter_57_17]|nr:Holliday junction branch migration protein RuvA [bacterium]NCT20637.1 Holliday junction branch migration protein RuvA [bacterium]OIO85681.1 MAG: Holliday junction DNA helicase RuvA [Anaerolineae bacterium CG2_30_57_67]PJB64596.1 MAG: Holliday junction branch migration protein RuvA [Anaerolineae bacterium CG_4_9_14_3_um_filter_57_17]
MIATLRGEITQVEENALVLEVGGVGLRVFTPKPLLTQFQPGEIVLLHTHLVVRENDLALYGFESASERQLFTTLLGADGVGPKMALSVLSTLDQESLQRAVFSEEPDLLSRVPGVGKKTAQKLMFYLKDRLKPISGLERIAALSDADGEVLAALTALGYSVIEAQTALQSLPKDAPQEVETRLRLALGYFR